MKYLALLVLFLCLKASAAPLTNAQTFGAQHVDAFRNGTPGMIMVKGTGDNNAYMLEADPTTGAIPVSGALSPATGRSSALLYRNDYSSVNVTTAAYVQVIASTTSAINRLCDFDSSGSAIIIATGAAASEVDQLYIPPGGAPYCYELAIPISTRIAIKALDTNATLGQIILTALN